jgi:hypothetical protein
MTDNDDLLRAFGTIDRRNRRERIDRALKVIKAAQKAGLPVKGATIEGVALEFGEPGGSAITTELDQWIAKQHGANSAERH